MKRVSSDKRGLVRLITAALSIFLLASSCADDAGDSNGPGATISLPPDATIVRLTDREVIDNTLATYFLGVYNADEAMLRSVLCSDVYPEDSVEMMAKSLAALPRQQRFGLPESAEALTEFADDDLSGTTVADVETLGIRGTVTLHAVRREGGCIDDIEVSDPGYVGYLVPTA